MIDHRRHHLRVADEYGAVEQDQADKQLQTVDVIPRLQQHPHRQQGGDGGIAEQQQDPACIGGQAHDLFRQFHRDLRAHINKAVEGYDAHHGHYTQADYPPVDQLADYQCHRNGAPHRHHGAGVVDQQLGDDHAEDGVDHQQHQEDDDHEHGAGASTDNLASQGANGFRSIADAGPEGAAIVDAGKEDGAENDPQEGGQPAPDYRDGRPDNRCGAGHRGKVMAPQHKAVGRNKIHAVLEFVGRRAKIRVELVDARGDKAGVE